MGLQLKSFRTVVTIIFLGFQGFLIYLASFRVVQKIFFMIFHGDEAIILTINKRSV